MHIDIVILPPPKLGARIGRFVIGLSKEFLLAKIVDNRKLLPHVSLFHMNILAKDLDKVIKSANQLAQSHRSFKLSFTRAGGQHLVFAISTKPTLKLDRLHEHTVNAAYRLHSGTENLPPGPKKDIHKRYIKEYGVGNILKCYWPHITLGWAKHEQDIPEIFKAINNFNFGGFDAQRLVVAEVDDRHQVKKILKEFKLKK